MPEKYREEIEEILKKAGEAAPRDPSGGPKGHREDLSQDSRPVRRVRTPSYGGGRRRFAITPGKILLAGLVIFIVAAMLKLGTLVWIGLGMLVVAYLLFFITPRSVSYDKMWRGRPVEERESSPWGRFKRWLKS